LPFGSNLTFSTINMKLPVYVGVTRNMYRKNVLVALVDGVEMLNEFTAVT
jgi:hypothetical protein